MRNQYFGKKITAANDASSGDESRKNQMHFQRKQFLQRGYQPTDRRGDQGAHKRCKDASDKTLCYITSVMSQPTFKVEFKVEKLSELAHGQTLVK